MAGKGAEARWMKSCLCFRLEQHAMGSDARLLSDVPRLSAMLDE